MAFLGSVGSWISDNLFNIAGVGASAASGAMTYQGVKDTNAANQAIAREQMGFQREMSNTSYQRAMADMKQAGLNPMLAFQQGGASTPGGASSTSQNALGSGVSSAVDTARAMSELKNMSAVNSNLKEQNRQIAADVLMKTAQTGVYNSQKAGIDFDNYKKGVKSIPYQIVDALVKSFDKGNFSHSAKSHRLGTASVNNLPRSSAGIGKSRGRGTAGVKAGRSPHNHQDDPIFNLLKYIGPKLIPRKVPGYQVAGFRGH